MSITTDPKPLVYRGAKEIGEAAGIDHKRICYYVTNLGLPAFKIEPGSKTWLATEEDLTRWIEQRKKMYFEQKTDHGDDYEQGYRE